MYNKYKKKYLQLKYQIGSSDTISTNISCGICLNDIIEDDLFKQIPRGMY